MILDPASPQGRYDLVFNRMSPSAFQRGGAQAVFATADYLDAWERAGVRVVNGSAAWRTEISKIRQLDLIASLGLAYPDARFVQPGGVRAAAREIGFPLVLKPNVGGSGAGVVRYDSLDELVRGACALEAEDNGMSVEAFDVPDEVAREVTAIAGAAGIEVGGIEYTFDPETGERLYYDVNALSNFVADGPRVLGFDPFERLVHWLERQVDSRGAAA